MADDMDMLVSRFVECLGDWAASPELVFDEVPRKRLVEDDGRSDDTKGTTACE